MGKPRADRPPRTIPLNKSQELVFFREAMASPSIPQSAEPSKEIEWIAEWASAVEVPWMTGPSRVAIRWLREVRVRRAVRLQFWDQTWSRYMERRLALSMKAAKDVPAVVAGESAEDGSAAMELLG